MHVYQELSTSREFRKRVSSFVHCPPVPLSVSLCTMLVYPSPGCHSSSPLYFLHPRMAPGLHLVAARRQSLVLLALDRRHDPARVLGGAELEVPDALPRAGGLRSQRERCSCVESWGGGGLFGETHELAVLDGDGDARADQRGLDVSLHKHTHVSNLSSPPEPRSTGKHPPACRPSPQHHAYTAPRPWAPRTARPSRARPSCRGGRPRPSSR